MQVYKILFKSLYDFRYQGMIILYLKLEINSNTLPFSVIT